ncbi:MAG: alpha/beta fold hydrolase [Aquabacterium sp.]
MSAAHQSLTLGAADGFGIAARLHGDATTARAGVVIAAAMGVPQRFYGDLAQWLAGQGLLVLTFDYRGIGDSRPGALQRSLRGLKTDIDLWAHDDAAAALAEMDRQLGPRRALHWLGHSLGAQIMAMVPGHERVASLLAMASGSGSIDRLARPMRRRSRLLMHVIGPVVLATLGWFPGRRLGIMDDMPGGALRQWMRWCRSPHYLMSEGGAERRARYAAFRQPLLVVGFTDDEFMSERSTRALTEWYTGAQTDWRRVAPADIGVPRIGHFDAYKARIGRERLWPQLLQFIDRHTPGQRLETAA